MDLEIKEYNLLSTKISSFLAKTTHIVKSAELNNIRKQFYSMPLLSPREFKDLCDNDPVALGDRIAKLNGMFVQIEMLSEKWKDNRKRHELDLLARVGRIESMLSNWEDKFKQQKLGLVNKKREQKNTAESSSPPKLSTHLRIQTSLSTTGSPAQTPRAIDNIPPTPIRAFGGIQPQTPTSVVCFESFGLVGDRDRSHSTPGTSPISSPVFLGLSRSRQPSNSEPSPLSTAGTLRLGHSSRAKASPAKKFTFPTDDKQDNYNELKKQFEAMKVDDPSLMAILKKPGLYVLFEEMKNDFAMGKCALHVTQKQFIKNVEERMLESNLYPHLDRGAIMLPADKKGNPLPSPYVLDHPPIKRFSLVILPGEAAAAAGIYFRAAEKSENKDYSYMPVAKCYGMDVAEYMNLYGAVTGRSGLVRDEKITTPLVEAEEEKRREKVIETVNAALEETFPLFVATRIFPPQEDHVVALLGWSHQECAPLDIITCSVRQSIFAGYSDPKITSTSQEDDNIVHSSDTHVDSENKKVMNQQITLEKIRMGYDNPSKLVVLFASASPTERNDNLYFDTKSRSLRLCVVQASAKEFENFYEELRLCRSDKGPVGLLSNNVVNFLTQYPPDIDPALRGGSSVIPSLAPGVSPAPAVYRLSNTNIYANAQICGFAATASYTSCQHQATYFLRLDGVFFRKIQPDTLAGQYTQTLASYIETNLASIRYLQKVKTNTPSERKTSDEEVIKIFKKLVGAAKRYIANPNDADNENDYKVCRDNALPFSPGLFDLGECRNVDKFIVDQAKLLTAKQLEFFNLYQQMKAKKPAAVSTSSAASNLLFRKKRDLSSSQHTPIFIGSPTPSSQGK